MDQVLHDQTISQYLIRNANETYFSSIVTSSI